MVCNDGEGSNHSLSCWSALGFELSNLITFNKHDVTNSKENKETGNDQALEWNYPGSTERKDYKTHSQSNRSP